MIAPAPLMTTEELLKLPENGMDQWLIRGHLREEPMTKRNRWHSRSMSRIGHLLEIWLDQQPAPRGAVLVGEAGCRIRHNPDTTVGVDVVYLDPAVAAQQRDETTIIEGVPTLVVEIQSPSDTVENTEEKIEEYLQAGVPVIWIANPHFRTVTVYRPGAEPELFNATQHITAEPHLPGFRAKVADFFVW